MRLLELFNTSRFSLSDVKKSDSTSLSIESEIGGRTIEFLAFKSGDSHWDIEFSEMERDDDGYEQRNYDLTKKGSAPQVLSYVIECIKHLIKLHDPKVIEFSASKKSKSRADVYEKMMKREFPAYEVKKSELYGGDRFDLIKRDKR